MYDPRDRATRHHRACGLFRKRHTIESDSSARSGRNEQRPFEHVVENARHGRHSLAVGRAGCDCIETA
jgi:hypothetical protein